MHIAHIDGGGDIVHGGVLVQRMTDRDDRSAIASTHARGADNPDPIAEPAAQPLEQLHRAREFAAEAIADAHGQLRRWRLAVHDDVEMGVKRGDLVDLDEREPHFLGERRQMTRMEAAEMVLQEMQVLDQQVTPALALAEQRLHLCERRRIDLPPFRVIRPPTAPRARVDAAVVFCCKNHNQTS